tara:strand:- start:3410 stop:3724 length:315 start_codon:yes stop_codon:yes gene_type:complete
MNLYKEATEIAKEAYEDTKCFDEACDRIHEICDGHEISIYYGKAIQFCAEHPTHRGEEYLEDCGGIAQDGDTFGSIACRIAYATLFVSAQDALSELQDEIEEVS